MKKFSIVLFALYLIVYLIYPNQNLLQAKNNQTKASTIEYNINLTYKNGNILLTNYKEDKAERRWGTINNIQYMLYKNINQYIYANGNFYQVNGKWVENTYQLPESEAKELFNLEGSKGKYATTIKNPNNICSNINKEDVLKRLSQPNIPIVKATITKVPAQMPGAERTYRNGTHEGFDWYSGYTGVIITKKTQVHPMFEGKIIRIDKDFVELTPQNRQELLDQSMKASNTSQQTLDKLRGRQVWIQSKNGVLVHYAHLSSVNPELNIGDKVKTSDWIGTVGNSGTSNGALGNNEDLHLHTDLLVCGKNFYEYGELNDMNNSLIQIFDQATKKNNNPDTSKENIDINNGTNKKIIKQQI